MKGLLLPLDAVGPASVPYDGLNTLGRFAASVSVSVAGGATLAVEADDAVGGKSSPPLRPQPDKFNAATLTNRTAHPETLGRKSRFTAKSPMRAAPYKHCSALARAQSP